jgi:hypothetical protein
MLQPPPRCADGKVVPSQLDTIGRLVAPSSDTEADGASYQAGLSEVMDCVALAPEGRVGALNSTLGRNHSQLVRDLAFRVASSYPSCTSLPGIAGITSGSSVITEATVSAVAVGLGVSIVMLGSEVGKPLLHGEGPLQYPFFVLHSPMQGNYTCLVFNALPVFEAVQKCSFPPSPASLWPVSPAGPSMPASTSPGEIAPGGVPL